MRYFYINAKCRYVENVLPTPMKFHSLGCVADDGSMMFDFVDAVKSLQMVMQQQVQCSFLTVPRSLYDSNK